MRKALLLLLLCGCATLAQAQFSMAEQFEASAITNRFGETMPVRLWRHYQPKDRPVPVLVLLHGSGECGADNSAQLAPFQSLYKSALLDSSLPPALYVIPQCTRQNGWVRVTTFTEETKLPRYPAPALRTVKEYLDTLVAEGTADPERLYIGGYSLGGYGAWDAIARWEGYFAAAVPVCGGGSATESAVKAMAKTSIWAFHGSQDPTVPVAYSRRLIAALMREGVGAKYTEYEGAGHNIWGRAFGDSAMLRWVFRQKRGKVESAQGQTPVHALFRQLKAYVTPD